MSFWLRSGWVASEADSEKKQARHQAGLRVRRWSFESTGLGRLGDTNNVFTECGVKEGMKHHLRDRNNWSLQDQQGGASQVGRSSESGRERKRLLGSVLLMELRLLLVLKKRQGSLSSEDTDGQEQSRSRQLLALGSQTRFISLTANMALTVTCLIVMGSCGGTIKRKRQKTQCTQPQKTLGTLWFPHPPVQHQGI